MGDHRVTSAPRRPESISLVAQTFGVGTYEARRIMSGEDPVPSMVMAGPLARAGFKFNRRETMCP